MEKRGSCEWWFTAPLPDVRAKLTECYHMWMVARGGEYQELLHMIAISRLLAYRLKEEGH